MFKARILAHVVWKNAADTTHTLWQCNTPDCGTEVHLEDDD